MRWQTRFSTWASGRGYWSVPFGAASVAKRRALGWFRPMFATVRRADAADRAWVRPLSSPSSATEQSIVQPAPATDVQPLRPL